MRSSPLRESSTSCRVAETAVEMMVANIHGPKGRRGAVADVKNRVRVRVRPQRKQRSPDIE